MLKSKYNSTCTFEELTMYWTLSVPNKDCKPFPLSVSSMGVGAGESFAQYLSPVPKRLSRRTC